MTLHLIKDFDLDYRNHADALPFETLGEVARIETYAETPDIHKETFVRDKSALEKKSSMTWLKLKQRCVKSS